MIVVPARQDCPTNPGQLIGGGYDHHVARSSGFQYAHPGALDCDGPWGRTLGRLHFINLRSDSSRLPVWNLAVRAVQTRGCTTQMNTGTLQVQLSMSEIAWFDNLLRHRTETEPASTFRVQS